MHFGARPALGQPRLKGEPCTDSPLYLTLDWDHLYTTVLPLLQKGPSLRRQQWQQHRCTPVSLSPLHPSCTPQPAHAGQGWGLPGRATGATFVSLSGCFPFWANAQFNCTSYCVIPVQSCSKIPTSTPFPFRSLQSPFCLISTVISRAELRFLPFRPQALSDAVAAKINPHPEQSRNDLLQVEVVLFPSRLIYQPSLRSLRSAEAQSAGASGGSGD